jgi:hypothetical protein
MTSLYTNSRLLAFSYQFKVVSLKLIAISFFLTCVGTQNLSAQACGSCATANCSGIKQYVNKAAAQAGIGKVWNYYSPSLTNAAGTFTVYANVTTDAYGQVAVMQEFQIKGPAAGLTAQAQAIAATRTYKLFTMSDVACTSGILPANIVNDGSSTTFNPAWTNLLPNTNYKLALTTNISGLGAYTYDGFNIRFYYGVRPVSSFAFNCGTASALGTFTANAMAGQTGTLNIPITGATSGSATFSVTGTGFTGSVTTNIAAGQTAVSIPIIYDGTGAAGNRTLAVTSSQGTGTCTPSVSVTILMSSFAFNCGTASETGTFIANATTGQSGTITIPLSNATAGQASFSVSGSGFSGATTTTLTANQASVTMPIIYNGSGTSGNHLVTITSPQGSGTCALNIPVTTPTGGFVFNCGTASVAGSFIANGTTGQSGFLAVPITGAAAGSVTLTVAGAGFSGTLTTVLTNNQTQVVIPITYNGSGSAGAIPLSITSSQGTGTCGTNATVTAVSTVGAITFNCPTTAAIAGAFVANGVSQTGLLVVSFTTQTAGQITLTVAGSGFTGTYAGSVVAGQTSVTLLVTYDGSDVSGNHAVTVTSSQATGACAMNIPVQAQFDFACANYNTASSFTANSASQNGTLVIPLSNTAAGSATFAVSGNGFTGSLTTVLQDSQRFVAIPVVYDGTGAAGVHAVTVTSSQASGPCSANVVVKDPALDGCDYLLGQSVSFSVNSQSTYTGYSTHYILVDAAGVIQYQTATLPFTGVAIGSYDGYAVNYSGTAPTLTVGTNLSAIGGTCAGLSNALPIKMCAAYQFSCGAATYTGVFIANGTGGQTGTLTITLLNALAIPTTISVSSNGFTGSVTQTLSLGTNTIVIPITYDGTGTGGTKLLTITGTNALGTCATGVDVLPPPPASAFAFTCGSPVIDGVFIADNTLQSGSVTIPLTGVVVGTTNFTVTGTGFSGGLTNVVLTAGQTSIAIPVVYDGRGPAGTYAIVVNSPNATAACMTNVTVTGTCVAGTTAPTLSGTTLFNTCPIATVNLNSLHTGTIPNGVRLRWHSVATNPMATDSVATPSVLAASGTYYAYYFDQANNCYSPASSGVTVTITGCASPLSSICNNGSLDLACRGSNCIYPYPNLATPLTIAGRDNNYSVFVGGNITINDGAEMEGKVFAYGNFTLNKDRIYNLGWVGVGSFVVPDANQDYLTVGGNILVPYHTATNTFPRIEVGGTIYGGAPVNGNVRVKGSISGGTPSGPEPVVVYAPSQIISDPTMDLSAFDACFTTVNQNSQCWGSKPQSANVTYQYDSGNSQYVFTSTNGASGLYIVNLTDDLDNGVSWAAANFVNFPDDATILININMPGSNDNIGFLLSDMIGLSPKLRQRVIWNFPDAQNVSLIGYAQFWGSVVLPSRTSTFTMAMPGFNGRVVVGGNLVQQAGTYEFHNYSFQGDLSSITCVALCAAGTTAPSVSATTLSNNCPATTVNLNSLVTSATPSGARLRWHTVPTNPMVADSVATPSVLATAGTYYAYYFDAIANCYSPVSVAVTVTINTAPAAPTTTVSQPTCAVATGTITVTAPTSGVTYSFDNGATYQPSNIKSSLAAATTYQVLVKDDATNCVSAATPSVINAALSVPNAPTTTVSPPTCAVSTGLITVTIPASGVTYSFDNGTTFQPTATSSALASGTYQVIVKDDVSNCVSTANATAINAQPATPVISLVGKGDPSVSSCPMLNNGTISVTAIGSNLLYSKDNGATWQANNVFSLLTAGSYWVKVKDSGTNCETVYASNPLVLTAPSCGTGCLVPKPSITGH